MTAILELTTGKKRRFRLFPPGLNKKPEKISADVDAYRLELWPGGPSSRGVRQILDLRPDILAMEDPLPLPGSLRQFPLCRGAGLIPPLALRHLLQMRPLKDCHIALLGISVPETLFWLKALLELGAVVALWDWEYDKSEVLSTKFFYRYGKVVETIYRPDLAEDWDCALLLSPRCPYRGGNALAAYRINPLFLCESRAISPAMTEGLLLSDGFSLPESGWNGEVLPYCRSLWTRLDDWGVSQAKEAEAIALNEDL